MSRDPNAPPLIRYLGRPLYCFAALLIGFSVLDFLLNVWPVQPSVLAWRYAGEGLFSGSVLTIALGLLLINGLALLGKNYRALERAMLLEIVFALIYFVFAVDFALSMWRLRDTALPDLDVRLVFEAGGAKVAFKYFATGLLQLLAALGSFRWKLDNPPPLEMASGPKRPWWLFWWPEPDPPPRRSR